MSRDINIKGFDSSFTDEESVLALLQSKGLSTADYNPMVNKIINMSKDEVSKLTLETLTDYLYLIGQHLIYLNNQFTIHKYIYTKIKVQYDELMADFEREVKGRNVAERRATVHREYPDLKKLQDWVSEAKLEKEMLEGKTEIMLEFLNTLKHKKETLMLEVKNQYSTLS